MLLILPAGLYGQDAVSKLYNVNDGLPSLQTYGAYQDKYGYLWVSTCEGISRFDGRQFTNYGLADGLPSLCAKGFFQDSRERLWVGTGAGMAQFKNNRFVIYPTSDNQFVKGVSNFFETKNKKVWACTSKGVYEFADTVWKKVLLYPGYKDEPCRNIIEKNEELYVSYRDAIVCRTKDGKWLRIVTPPDNGSTDNIISVQNNQIWISIATSVYEIRNHKLFPVYKKAPTSDLQQLYYLVDSKRHLWLAGADYLKVSKPGDWQHFTDSINRNGYHYFISEDSSHNVWTGTAEGLLKIKDISFSTIDKNNAALPDEIYNIIALHDNRLIFSSGTNSGLQLYANNRCKQILPPIMTSNKNYYTGAVVAYAFDDKNTLWMVTNFNRFLHFNGKRLDDFSDAMHLKIRGSIFDMDYVRSRKQFFICADSTLLYGDSSKLSTFIPKNTGVPIIIPWLIHGMKNGLLLLFIEGHGVYCIDESNNLISLIKETGFNGSNKGYQWGISFHEDNSGNLWITFPGRGLYEYGFTKNKRPFLETRITVKDGLQSNKILSLTNDRQNRIWVASSSGLDILQKNNAGNWEVFNYGKAGDFNISVTDGEKLACDTDGNVWLSSPQKIIKFNAATIRLQKESPHIIIEKVTLAFKETNWSKLADSLYSYYELPYHPVLSYNQNSLGIFFNAIDLSMSNSNPEYSYKLIPLDTSWSTPSKTKSISFAQLPAGTYRFIVKTKDLASGWSKPTTFIFTIKQPFWNQWWFRIIIVAIAAFIIISIFKARVKKIRNDAFIQHQLKELEMKALKAQMNPHFIYNALNSIQALVANDKKAEGIHYIGSFSRLLRGVLDNSENNVISLDKELETVDLYIQLESLRLDMQLHYKKIVPENVVTEFEKIPPLVLQPFVENALWHGLSRKEGEKEIKITVSLNDDWLFCEITDNGIGREKAQELKNDSKAIHQSKAIDITRRRLIDFNEGDSVSPVSFFDLRDDQQNPSGTRVVLQIKRKNS
jgi:ligand-binding sensor domain-containing protein